MNRGYNGKRKHGSSPSKVALRLKLAREKPLADDPVLVRLLHYRNILLHSEAKPEEIKDIDSLIEQVKASQNSKASCSASNEVDESYSDDKQSKKFQPLDQSEEDELNVHFKKSLDLNGNEQFTDPEISCGGDSALAETSGEVVTIPFKTLRLPRHLIKSETDASEVEASSASMDAAARRSRVRNFLLRANNEANCTRQLLDDDIDSLTKQMENYGISKLKECICNRNVSKTLCICCEQIFEGRVFHRCKIHVRIPSFDDHFYCPNCNADASNLCEINEDD